MSKVVIKAENISKQYRLGLVGTGTIKDDMKRWWYKMRGAEDPFLKIGVTLNTTKQGTLKKITLGRTSIDKNNWCDRRESNPGPDLGKVEFYH